MKVERRGSPGLHVQLGAYEMAALMAAARWAVEGGQGDLAAEARDHLRHVLSSYESEMERLRSGAPRRPP